MSCYAFVLGVNGEWPEQRASLGDVGLARCLRDHCGAVPGDHLVEVYDHRATRSNALRALEGLLDRRNRDRREASKHGSGGKDCGGTLLFCYGGHGERRAFCTRKYSICGNRIITEPWLKHSEVIDILERKFIGGTAVCLVDCCHSGGFGEAVVQKSRKSPLNVKYACIMSVPPGDVAGMEWSMTECFQRTFRGGDILPSSRGHSEVGDGGRCYYLSTKDGYLYEKGGKRRIDRSKLLLPDATQKGRGSSGECYNSHHPTWGQVVDYLADEYGRIKGDRLTTLFLGDGMEDGAFLRRPCAFGDRKVHGATRLSPKNGSIPRDLSWMRPFSRKAHEVDDWVHVKVPHNEKSEGCRVGWFPGRIVSINSSGDGGGSASATPNVNGHGSNTISKHLMARIELHDVITKTRWVVSVLLDPSPTSSRHAVLGGLPFSYGFGLDSHVCTNALAKLAGRLACLDATIPPNVDVETLWAEEGKYHEATTLCPTDVPWGDVDWKSSANAAGLCVAVRWVDDGTISFVPTNACVVKDSKRSNKKMTLADKSAMVSIGRMATPLDAMMASFSCGNKHLHGDAPLLDPLLGGALPKPGPDQDANFLEAYDAEDGKWSAVRLMNKIDPSHLPPKVLACHALYREAGGYSVVFWESDATLALVPDGHLRQRRAEEEAGDDRSGSDEDSSSGDANSSAGTKEDFAEEAEEVRRHVEEVSRHWEGTASEGSGDPARKRRFELGSCAIACLGLGFLFGSRSKR